jgi:hypothetical protein
MLAAVALALAVARTGALRGMPAAAVIALAALVVVNPANGDALQRGHPEEILAAAMLAGAALIAGGRPLFAGVLVGLAMATKQWALLGLFPVAFLATEGERLRLIGTSIAVAAILTLPMAIANTGAFRHATRAAANPPGTAKPFDVWFPFADHAETTTRLPDGSIGIGKVWTLPRAIDRGAHWLVIVLCAGLILAWWLRRERSGPAILLLALVLLLRVLLDPRAHPYHLTPFVLVLALVEVTWIARFPWRMFTAAAVLALTLRMFDTGLWLTASLVFIAFAVPAAVALGLGAFRPRGRAVAGRGGLAAARPGYG